MHHSVQYINMSFALQWMIKIRIYSSGGKRSYLRPDQLLHEE